MSYERARSIKWPRLALQAGQGHGSPPPFKSALKLHTNDALPTSRPAKAPTAEGTALLPAIGGGRPLGYRDVVNARSAMERTRDRSTSRLTLHYAT